MAGGACEYPGCGRPAERRCDRCRRMFCARHNEPLYAEVGARSPYRCALCAKEARAEARQHRRHPRGGLLAAVTLFAAGVATVIIGTALAPASDSVTVVAIVGMILAGIGAISAAYSFFS